MVLTNSPMVKKAREGVMEFLLINHPLDCPICDQGGECDLQDQAMAYGRDRSRFTENKHAVENKYIGPLVKTEMTRCIHCTRCVRFTAEICGTSDMGTIGRGEDMEITTYLEQRDDLGIAGQRHRLLPGRRAAAEAAEFPRPSVGVNKTAGVDVMDALGSASASTRAAARSCASCPAQRGGERGMDFRQDAPDHRRPEDPASRPSLLRENGKLKPASWSEAFAAIAAKVKAATPEKSVSIGGDLLSVEEIFMPLKSLADSLGVKNIDCASGRRETRSALGPRLLSVQRDGRGDRPRRRPADHRLQSALGIPVLNARIRRAGGPVISRWR